MEIKVISSTDDMLDVWRISRPHVLKSEDDSLTNMDLLKMNLPINQFKVLTLHFKTSILFRDLIFTFRPTSSWAKSNRIVKFTKDNIWLSEDASILLTPDHLLEVHKKLDSVVEMVTNGERQDYAKKYLPLMTETEFCINVNYRTLINIVHTFEVHFPAYFVIFYNALCEVIKEFNYEYKEAIKTDLYNDVALTDDEIEMKEGHQSLASINVIKVNIKANLMAQFIRQHSSTIKNGLWNLVQQTYYAVCMSDCSLDVDCVAIISDSRWKNLVSTRSCWFAQMDKEDNSSWSYVLGDYIDKLKPQEFMRILPCKGCGSNCKILKDMMPKIDHSDVNPPCPILLSNPFIIDQRMNQYQSDSRLMKKWKECQKFIINNPVHPYNVHYGSINKEAGTNVR